MHALRHILLMGVMFSLAACSTSDYFLGKDNHPPAKALPQIANQLTTTLLWQQAVGNNGAEQGLSLQPGFWNNQVFAVAANGTLRAFQLDNGASTLNVKLGNKISAGVAAANGRLFVGTANGSLLALDAQNGQPLWRQPLSSMMLAAPVVAGEIVLARAIDGTLTAFHAGSGETLWRYHSNEPTLSVRGNAQPVVGGGVVILTTDNGYFIVLDERTGLPVLEQRITAGIGSDPVSRLVDMDTTPKISRNVLYGAAYQSMIFAVDLQAGQPLWRQENASTPKDIALTQNVVIAVNDIDHIIGISQRDGSILWENDALEGRYLSPPFATPNGWVGVLDRDGYLHWLNGQTGEIIGQKHLAAGGATTAAEIVGGRIIWQLNNGNLISFRPGNL